jgi:hypothetical protein
MAEIKIFHSNERPYISDAIKAYFDNNEQISSEWKAWLDHLLDALQTDQEVIQVEDKNNYIQSFYNMVLASYINDEFRRARNSPNVINGFSYGNTGHFLRGWSF